MKQRLYSILFLAIFALNGLAEFAAIVVSPAFAPPTAAAESREEPPTPESNVCCACCRSVNGYCSLDEFGQPHCCCSPARQTPPPADGTPILAMPCGEGAPPRSEAPVPGSLGFRFLAPRQGLHLAEPFVAEATISFRSSQILDRAFAPIPPPPQAA